MKNFTRIDKFDNIGEVMKFWEWCKTQPPEKKTREDMVRLLAQYKKADLYVEAHKERVESLIVRGIKSLILAFKKGD